MDFPIMNNQYTVKDTAKCILTGVVVILIGLIVLFTLSCWATAQTTDFPIIPSIVLLVIFVVNYIAGYQYEHEWHEPENPPLEGPELWYWEWSHRPGSACVWPPKS